MTIDSSKKTNGSPILSTPLKGDEAPPLKKGEEKKEGQSSVSSPWTSSFSGPTGIHAIPRSLKKDLRKGDLSLSEMLSNKTLFSGLDEAKLPQALKGEKGVAGALRAYVMNGNPARDAAYLQELKKTVSEWKALYGSDAENQKALENIEAVLQATHDDFHGRGWGYLAGEALKVVKTPVSVSVPVKSVSVPVKKVETAKTPEPIKKKEPIAKVPTPSVAPKPVEAKPVVAVKPKEPDPAPVVTPTTIPTPTSKPATVATPAKVQASFTMTLVPTSSTASAKQDPRITDFDDRLNDITKSVTKAFYEKTKKEINFDFQGEVTFDNSGSIIKVSFDNFQLKDGTGNVTSEDVKELTKALSDAYRSALKRPRKGADGNDMTGDSLGIGSSAKTPGAVAGPSEQDKAMSLFGGTGKSSKGPTTSISNSVEVKEYNLYPVATQVMATTLNDSDQFTREAKKLAKKVFEEMFPGSSYSQYAFSGTIQFYFNKGDEGRYYLNNMYVVSLTVTPLKDNVFTVEQEQKFLEAFAVAFKSKFRVYDQQTLNTLDTGKLGLELIFP